jgi:hypothetical protein
MVFGMHHQLGGSTEDDMNKMSVIGHISLVFFTIRKRTIASTLRFRLTPSAAAFLAKIKNLFAKIHLAWSVLHGVDSPFRTTAIIFR